MKDHRVRYLIVNGDDFGMSPPVSRGIIEAHRRGILTSTSLMVNRPAAEEAAALAREAPRLGVGLHLELEEPTDDPGAAVGRDGRLARLAVTPADVSVSRRKRSRISR